MHQRTRRTFLGDVGRGMVTAGLGASLATELGFSAAFAEEGSAKIDFGTLEPLIDLMQTTPPAKLQEQLVARLTAGQTDLRQLTSAAALANAETFGGQDYVGFHTAMAFVPAFEMARQLPTEKQPLPVLKVLYRNADQIQQLGGKEHVILKPIDRATLPEEADHGQLLRDAARQAQMQKAEGIFAASRDKSPQAMLDILQLAVQDSINVHRFVLAHRAYRLIDIVGQSHAHTLLRQCVRFCVDHEQNRIARGNPESPIRSLMPKLLDQYRLVGREPGRRQVDDPWIDEMSRLIYQSTPEQACDAVAAALAEGIDPETVGQAIALAANLLVLRHPADKWRAHGDSPGVHASDAMNAWRNMARVTNGQLAITGLIVGAYHTAAYDAFATPPFPLDEHRDLIDVADAKALLAAAEEAIQQNDQGRVCAAIAHYVEQGHPAKGVFDLMLRYTISEDGRLHGEKFYQTVTEEYATTRPVFRPRLLIGLARVTASAYGYNREDQHGYRAPGYAQACRLLNLNT